MKKTNPEQEENLKKIEFQHIPNPYLTRTMEDMTTISMQKPIQMTWKPKEDITTYELALCVPYFTRYFVMSWEIDQSLPHFRHFEIFDPNK